MKERRSRNGIAKAFQHHALDVLCLSALGQLNESLGPDMLKGWVTLSVEQPISIYYDDHCVTVVKNTRVHIAHDKLIRGLVPDQTDRSFQLFRVRVAETVEQVCINCEAPASKTRGLSADGRMC